MAAERHTMGHGHSEAADQLAADLARQLQQRTFSRRRLLQTAGYSAVAVGASGVLAACGTVGTKQSAEDCVSEDLSSKEKVLNFSNWPEYIDVDDSGKRMPTLEDFEKKTGINVRYSTDVNDNNQFFAKVRNQLGACEPTGRDIFVLTDWMAARVINLGWTQELDHANMPNVTANMQGRLKAASWDPGRKHSVPWQSGLTGIAYNAKYTAEIASFEELVTRKDLKGKISMLTEMPDTMGFMLRLVGADPNKYSEDEWGEAIDRLKDIVASGQVRRFTGNDYVQALNKGDLVACEAWSGDVLAMQADNPDIKFVTPTEGLSLWSDNMMVPNKATHLGNAEKLMNYYYDPEIAARLAAWVNYICPVKGAQEAMKTVDPSLVDSPLIFPDAKMFARTFAMTTPDEKTRERYNKEFNQVIGA
jgi:spermidine/putrescine transport system substrate-binding protein